MDTFSSVLIDLWVPIHSSNIIAVKLARVYNNCTRNFVQKMLALCSSLGQFGKLVHLFVYRRDKMLSWSGRHRKQRN